ncbi:MAG: hypothetical protein MRK02_08565 [Candidatus Scalindua sp.]|nr:hypothetical protein [Candidatus Scalindua sp.]
MMVIMGYRNWEHIGCPKKSDTMLDVGVNGKTLNAIMKELKKIRSTVKYQETFEP